MGGLPPTQRSGGSKQVRESSALFAEPQNYLRDDNFGIGDSGTLDWFRGFLDDTLDEHDTLNRKTGSPLSHLLADLPGGHGQQRLHGVGPLSQVEENHLVPLSARGVDPRAEKDRLAIQCGSEVRNLGPGATRPGLRLVQRQFTVELDSIVLPGPSA